MKHLIETEGLSANAKDENGFTPMHAAASYAQLDMLTYLISKQGDVNIQDSDGDAPLHHCDTAAAARFLLSNSADAKLKNAEGNTVSCVPSMSSLQPEICCFLHRPEARM